MIVILTPYPFLGKGFTYFYADTEKVVQNYGNMDLNNLLLEKV
jgi:hypothetical protein